MMFYGVLILLLVQYAAAVEIVQVTEPASGGTLTLECSSEIATELKWHFSGMPMGALDRVVLTAEMEDGIMKSSVSVHSVTSSDSGTYKCSDPEDYFDSATVDVTIRDSAPPVSVNIVEPESGHLEVAELGSFNLRCLGPSSASLGYLLNDEPISSDYLSAILTIAEDVDAHTKIALLSIFDFTSEQAGTYTCLDESAPELSDSIEVTLQGPEADEVHEEDGASDFEEDEGESEADENEEESESIEDESESESSEEMSESESSDEDEIEDEDETEEAEDQSESESDESESESESDESESESESDESESESDEDESESESDGEEGDSESVEDESESEHGEDESKSESAEDEDVDAEIDHVSLGPHKESDAQEVDGPKHDDVHIGAPTYTISTSVGRDIRLECTTQGTPHITWKHNGETLAVTEKYNVLICYDAYSDRTKSVMKLQSVSMEDPGTYTCEHDGRILSSVDLTIESGWFHTIMHFWA